MFGWFKPRCPVDVAAKRWVENRLQWLSKQFGRDTFTRRAVILPTNDFFPDPMDGTEASVRNLLDQVCGFMDVNPNRVALELFTNKNELWLVNDDGKYLPTGAAGLIDKLLPFVQLLPRLFGLSALLYVIPGIAIVHYFTLHRYLYRYYPRPLY